jgi:hypothetical protein
MGEPDISLLIFHTLTPCNRFLEIFKLSRNCPNPSCVNVLVPVEIFRSRTFDKLDDLGEVARFAFLCRLSLL